MTRVGAISAGPVAARRPARLGGFGPALGPTPEAVGAAATAAAAPAGLLALQETGRVEHDPARAGRRAAAMLDDLRGLQLDLLSGGSDPARLARLAALAEGPEAADPALQAVLREVSLRARVELARRRAASATGT
jgi:hypothetical protein